MPQQGGGLAGNAERGTPGPRVHKHSERARARPESRANTTELLPLGPLAQAPLSFYHMQLKLCSDIPNKLFPAQTTQSRTAEATIFRV